MSEEQKTSEKKEVAIPAKFKGMVDEISKMSVLDLSELVKILEDKFGVTVAAPVAAVAVAGAAGGESAAEEKTSFTVELTGVGEKKVAVIKAIKEITQMGLQDAKALADSAPKTIKENVPKEEAEKMKEKLIEAGATVELK